jgi:hypothetical protein
MFRKLKVKSQYMGKCGVKLVKPIGGGGRGAPKHEIGVLGAPRALKDVQG